MSDYLIVSSNVNLLSTLGVTCVPSLSNNVEVSLKSDRYFIVIVDVLFAPRTTESSRDLTTSVPTQPTTSNSVLIFISSSSPASPKEVRISRIYPFIEPSSIKKLDNEGCVGCPSETIWSSAEIGYQVRGFCSETQQGYLYRSCILGESGNGVWADELSFECADVEASPSLETGEAYFRVLLNVLAKDRMESRSRSIRASSSPTSISTCTSSCWSMCERTICRRRRW